MVISVPINPADFNQYQAFWQPRIDAKLTELLEEIAAQKECPRALSAAMSYAVLNGGKRLRPLLTLAALRALGGEEEQGVVAGCALEIIHNYSLIHDDLPAMDDDDFRRGKPSCHRAHGEALAILAGDALLTYAFRLLVDGVPMEKASEAVALIAEAAGPMGMVGGQADDIQPWEQMPGIEEIEFTHRRKTGALFTGAVMLGGLLGKADQNQMRNLSSYGRSLGLAYQIVDDLLAWEGDEKRLGRPPNSDQARKRRTYPLVVGSEDSRKRITQLIDQAIWAIDSFAAGGDALRLLAKNILARALPASPPLPGF